MGTYQLTFIPRHIILHLKNGGIDYMLLLFGQNSGKLEKAEILEMTVQYLRALHSADFPRGREKGE